jgi:hypothetical protein
MYVTQAGVACRCLNELTGHRTQAVAIDSIGTTIWRLASVQNVGLSGATPVGIVGDAGRWVKTLQRRST